jgi:cysteine desulfurase/selenocysteine lyase
MSNSALSVRDDFPFLQRKFQGRPLAYLDNAATTQKPQQVVDCIAGLYASGVANVHRAVNFLADEVTESFEAARGIVADFLNAGYQEIIFTSGATQALNLVSASLRESRRPRVLTTTLEHHSNLLPWTSHSEVQYIPWAETGTLDLKLVNRMLREFKPHLVTMARASNFLGSLQPIGELARLAHSHGARLLVDASQSIAHEPHDVRSLECDFLVFSGHKIYGPSGVGVLYIRHDMLEDFAPQVLGGGMVKEVDRDHWVPNDIPYRFEAGTPNIEGVIGLGAAIQYLQGLGFEAIRAHECHLVRYAKERLQKLSGTEIFGPGPTEPSAPLVAFELEGLDPGTVAKTLAARSNVIVRSGFHCAQPAHQQLGIGPTIRASFGIYNSTDEIDLMMDILTAFRRFL